MKTVGISTAFICLISLVAWLTIDNSDSTQASSIDIPPQRIDQNAEITNDENLSATSDESVTEINNFKTLDNILQKYDYTGRRLQDIYGYVRAQALNGDNNERVNLFMIQSHCEGMPTNLQDLDLLIQERVGEEGDPEIPSEEYNSGRAHWEAYYDECLFVPRDDLQLARDQLEKAAQDGLTRAVVIYTWSPPRKDSFTPEEFELQILEWDRKSFDYLKQLASEGFVEPHYDLAMRYYFGQNSKYKTTPKDRVKALSHLIGLVASGARDGEMMRQEVEYFGRDLSAEQISEARKLGVVIAEQLRRHRTVKTISGGNENV